MNKHDIGGIITTVPELKFTAKNQTPVLNMLVSTSDKHRNRDGESRVQTTTHNVTCWGKLAETVAKNYQKGDFIMVSGRSETKKVNDKLVTELVVSTLENIHRSGKKSDD